MIPLDMTTPLLLTDKRFPPPAVENDDDDDDDDGGCGDDDDEDNGEDNDESGEDLELSDFDLLPVLDLFFDFALFGPTCGGANPSSPASTTLGVSLWNRPCANILVCLSSVLVLCGELMMVMMMTVIKDQDLIVLLCFVSSFLFLLLYFR